MKKFTLLEIADAVERFDKGEKVDGLDRFDMSYWWNWRLPGKVTGLDIDAFEKLSPEDQSTCETIGCIAGTTVALAIEEGIEIKDFDNIMETAIDLIDIPERIGYFEGCVYLQKLFMGYWGEWMPPHSYDEILWTPTEVADCIRKLHQFILENS